MSDIEVDTPSNEEAEDEAIIEGPAPSRGRRGGNGRKGTLLRGVLDRKQKDRDGSAIRESKETTPDVGSMDEDADTPSEETTRDPADHRWTDLPRGPIKGDEPFKRDSFHLYASVNIYCFFRLFETCYSRFKYIKEHEAAVHEDVRRAKIYKPADELNIADRKPADYFSDVSPDANYYRQILGQCESVVKNELEANHLEDTLRRFYIQKGWQLYTFDKILNACARFAMQILGSDHKDKSLDIIHLFYKNRKEDETTHDAELLFRKQVDKLSKDGEIYRITYVSLLHALRHNPHCHMITKIHLYPLQKANNQPRIATATSQPSRSSKRTTVPSTSIAWPLKTAGATTSPPSQCAPSPKACPSTA